MELLGNRELIIFTALQDKGIRLRCRRLVYQTEFVLKNMWMAIDIGAKTLPLLQTKLKEGKGDDDGAIVIEPRV